MPFQMTVCVFTPYKVGSQTLSATLTKKGIKVVKSHGLDTANGNIFIISLRDEIEIYPSAFFQDINVSVYEYYFSENESDILNAKMDELIQHFLKFDWTSYFWLNYEYYINILSEKLGKPVNAQFDEKYKIIENNGIKLGMIKTKHMKDHKCLSEFLTNLGFETKPSEIFVSGESKDKWYGDLYEKFKQNLPNSYYEKYSNRTTFN